MFQSFRKIFKKDSTPFVNAGDFFSHYEFDGLCLDEALEWAESGKVVTLAMAEYPEDYGYYKRITDSPFIKKVMDMITKEKEHKWIFPVWMNN